jgi:hypothetical protein
MLENGYFAESREFTNCMTMITLKDLVTAALVEKNGTCSVVVVDDKGNLPIPLSW